MQIANYWSNKDMKTLTQWFIVLCVSVFSLNAQAQGDFVEKELTKQQFLDIKKGGFVLYMRHGKTDPRQPDQLVIDFNDCSTQRLLSDDGRKITVDIGKAIKTAKLPIADIFVSPMCRTRESALLVFGEKTQFVVLDDLFSSTNQTQEEKKPIIAQTKKLLSDPVISGTNRFILAHAPNLADTMGYFPKLEATLVVFIPRGDSFEYVGSIRPDAWPSLVK
jgi:phosphohistidine phosphatase SixA